MNLGELREILHFPSRTTIERTIETIDSATNPLRGLDPPEKAEEEEKEPGIGKVGERILQILEGSDFSEYEEGLVEIVSEMTILAPEKLEEMDHPKTGEKGYWVPLLFKEPNLLEVWKMRRKEEERIPEAYLENNVRYPVGSAIVLLRNPNSSSYDVNVPIVVTKEFGTENEFLFQGVSSSGVQGNFLPTIKGDARAATLEEIRSFIRAFPR